MRRKEERKDIRFFCIYFIDKHSAISRHLGVHVRKEGEEECAEQQPNLVQYYEKTTHTYSQHPRG